MTSIHLDPAWIRIFWNILNGLGSKRNANKCFFLEFDIFVLSTHHDFGLCWCLSILHCHSLNYKVSVKPCQLAEVSSQPTAHIFQKKLGRIFVVSSGILVSRSVKPIQLVEVDPQPGGSLHLAHHERHHRLRHQVQACASFFVGPPLEVITWRDGCTFFDFPTFSLVCHL